jgi:hypothetical protein
LVCKSTALRSSHVWWLHIRFELNDQKLQSSDKRTKTFKARLDARFNF